MNNTDKSTAPENQIVHWEGKPEDNAVFMHCLKFFAPPMLLAIIGVIAVIAVFVLKDLPIDNIFIAPLALLVFGAINVSICFLIMGKMKKPFYTITSEGIGVKNEKQSLFYEFRDIKNIKLKTAFYDKGNGTGNIQLYLNNNTYLVLIGIKNVEEVFNIIITNLN